MSEHIEKKFYSYWPILTFYGRLSAICAAIFLACALLGQWMSGRLPIYPDLVFATLVPLVAFLIIALLIVGSDMLYPVKITRTGLASYNRLGHYSTVSWQQIQSVRAGEKLGMKCLYLKTSVCQYPLIIPLWLHNLDEFCQMVDRYAGQHHTLAIALKQYVSP